MSVNRGQLPLRGTLTIASLGYCLMERRAAAGRYEFGMVLSAGDCAALHATSELSSIPTS